LNLSAYGEVKAAPDMATISFGVVTEATTAAEAMRLNAARMNEVMTALRRAGIEERYVQTSGLNLSAQYDYVQNEPPRLRGYQANNRVTVIINDLTKVGTTADAVVAAGVNQIDGISFGLKDPTSAENQARQLAVRNLQAKARCTRRPSACSWAASVRCRRAVAMPPHRPCRCTPCAPRWPRTRARPRSPPVS
jgi:uncharacterized protein YggE